MIEAILNDPIAVAASLVLVTGGVLLLWALARWIRLNQEETEQTLGFLSNPKASNASPEPKTSSPPEPAPQEPPSKEPTPPKTPDLTDQLVERFNQMTERLYALEKREPQGPPELPDVTVQVEMMTNRLLTLEKVVQENTPQSGAGTSDKEISMVFKTLVDRIGALEKAVQAIQQQASSPTDKGGNP
jgi:hypothetical protein